MIYRGLQPDLHTYTIVISAYAKKKNFSKAIQHFEQAKADNIKLNSITYLAMIDCFASNGDMVNVEIWLEKLNKAGFKSTIHAHNSILKYLALKGTQAQMEEQYETICNDSKLFPTALTYHLMMRMYNKNDDMANMVVMYRTLLEKHKGRHLHQMEHAYYVLLDAAARTKNVELVQIYLYLLKPVSHKINPHLAKRAYECLSRENALPTPSHSALQHELELLDRLVLSLDHEEKLGEKVNEASSAMEHGSKTSLSVSSKDSGLDLPDSELQTPHQLQGFSDTDNQTSTQVQGFENSDRHDLPQTDTKVNFIWKDH